MNTYHCYEVATVSSYHIGTYESEAECNANFEKLINFLGDEVDTTSLGTCVADDVETATDLIRAGQWSYSQRC